MANKNQEYPFNSHGAQTQEYYQIDNVQLYISIFAVIQVNYGLGTHSQL